ncbi:Fur-regulated basic protein FbpA [Bacillus haynesii]|uniref:Fur-regulated basic protein FbpA n=1 Tax=Bacillus haynesii TaxID=1925021 RepID=UPI0022818903|nr:Fur-regulated basic protein FbpA [Bacillus haynesii]MCY8378440.1 Fur-regulated basic protein FbpA [Bacillus haynesii]MCY8611557.1 Fur-regulated basic protein FbpA [Bacillus haynesii]MEC0676695.1 Fur-regulated basic protein FbpA [Bacillus haynesii]
MSEKSTTDTASERQDYLIHELIKYGQYELDDGRQLYELSLAELERLHIKVKCDFGRKMSCEASD